VPGALRVAGVLFVAIPAIAMLIASLPATARDDEGPGFEEGFEEGLEEGLEETLGGFDEGDDYSSGFDDEPLERSDEGRDESSDVDPFWDLTGDLSLGTSYSYLTHSSATGTPYGNLSRLRAQLDLQLDLRLPADWKARIEGYGFYDFTYELKGRSQYTDDVLDDYEWEVDFREVWVLGSPIDSVDVKLGRQIVNWGRSDSLRVLDVINPLDNREPGLVDIEDLRLPVTMARFDYYPRWIDDRYGDWSVQLLVVPEFRQDRNPSVGNDFNPVPDPDFDPPSDKPRHFFDEPEYGGALSATFSGWDISLYAASIYANQPFITSALGGQLQRTPKVTMVGSGGNLTFGSWLVKGELAWFDGLKYNVAERSPVALSARVVDRSRLDAMAGIEYYGINDVQIAIEVVHRHIFDYERGMKHKVDSNGSRLEVAYAEENQLESALRVTADFFNSRMHVTGVGLILGSHAEIGSVVRLEASYDLRDALVLNGGIVFYQEGDSPAFQQIGDNDRLFLRLEYSF
jgi:hypothetical protein